MKVLIDISVLGLGLIHPRARTGVFRVVENVVEHLVLRPDCEINFCTFDREFVAYCVDYLANNKRLSGIPFVVPSLLVRELKIRKKRFGIIDAVNSGTLRITSRLLKKAQLRTLLMAERGYHLFNRDNILVTKKDLDGSDIFHSPFTSIPEEVQRSSIKSIFLTSYDLIPVLFPQFVEEGSIKTVRDALNSITPDTWIFCISHCTRNDLLNYLGKRVDPDKVIVTELAASSLFYKSRDTEYNKLIRKKYAIPVDQPYILSLCTLEPRKNIDHVIRSFIKLVELKAISDLNLVLVGTKGWKFEKIFHELEANAFIKDRIIITGFVDDEDLAALYSEALFFVYPSFYEGFGLPPLEAMQCGTPVITSDTSSLPEVVGDAGLMVSPTDQEAMCDAMLTLYNDSSLRQNLAMKSLERAKKFSWERCATETVNAYKASLNSSING